MPTGCFLIIFLMPCSPPAPLPPPPAVSSFKSLTASCPYLVEFKKKNAWAVTNFLWCFWRFCPAVEFALLEWTGEKRDTGFLCSEELSVLLCLSLRARSCLSLQMATESLSVKITCSVAARSLPRLSASLPAQRPAASVEPHQNVHPDGFKARSGCTACHR